MNFSIKLKILFFYQPVQCFIATFILICFVVHLLYVTMDHKTSHKCQFFEIEISTSPK